jgi:hypothetical protein
VLGGAQRFLRITTGTEAREKTVLRGSDLLITPSKLNFSFGMGSEEEIKLLFLVLCEQIKLHPASSGFEMNGEVVILRRLTDRDVIDHLAWYISHTVIIYP